MPNKGVAASPATAKKVDRPKVSMQIPTIRLDMDFWGQAMMATNMAIARTVKVGIKTARMNTKICEGGWMS